MYSKHKEVRGVGYIHYDNYDAIEVPFTDAIPDKYDGFMGVPISFLDKYCPDQFEIIGITESEGKGASNGIFNAQLPVTQPLTTPPGEPQRRLYKRIFIRAKNTGTSKI